GETAALRFHASPQILHLRRIFRGFEELDVVASLVAERETKPVANLDQIGIGELLGLMGRHAALGHFAQSVALHRLGENHRGPAFGHHGSPIAVIYLYGMESAAAEIPELIVAH